MATTSQFDKSSTQRAEESAQRALEFDVIKQQLADLAMSQRAKERLLALQPSLRQRECAAWTQETTQARAVLDALGAPPLTSMQELEKILDLVPKGAMLIPEQLATVAQFLASCRRMKAYLKKAEEVNSTLASLGTTIDDLPDLAQEIDRCIRYDAVDDGASPSLRNLRRKLENANTAVKAKLEALLRSKRDWFADSYVTTRAGRFVLPVKREYKNQITGTVVETSNTGGTYFIEPSSVRRLQEEIAALQIEEENEIRKVLYTLTGLVELYLRELGLNRECMETLDFLFAKAKLSAQMDASPAQFSDEACIQIKAGRHPLLEKSRCVPLDFQIGGGVRGVVITGPNTGGKTVALKTIGLLSLMAQSGLHVPAALGSCFSLNSNILCDIGDGQSITENLSTFSAHITSIIRILENTGDQSLVLLDELGSGTDPAEGMGLAVSILEELLRRGCLFVATTHYPEIKEYAASTPGLTNARMAFDRDSLQPLYQLQLGEAGESCALYIAQRLGFPTSMLRRAQEAAYGRILQHHNAPGGISPGKPESASAAPSITAPDLPAESTGAPSVRPPRVQREPTQNNGQKRSKRFQIGDSVIVYPQRELGIVYQTADDKGILVVQIKGKKQRVNHKRLKLKTPAADLYPEGYDFSILFDSVENRKARHQMQRQHRPDLEIVVQPEDRHTND